MTRAGVLATVALAGCAASPEPACQDALVPAYVSAASLVRLAEHGPLPSLLVVNPASGPGGAPDADFRRAISAVQAGGARALGYVSTDWGARPRAAVDADIEHFRAWYGVDGIFLDEAAHDAGRLEHYRALAADARSAGAGMVVLNPGVVPARAYFDVADVVVVFEGAYADYRGWHAPDWVASARTAHLVYGAPPDEAVAARNGAYLYVTTGTLPHPWGTVVTPKGCA
jgi:hypothetical protein